MLVRPDRNTSVPPVLIQAGGDDWRTVDLLPQVLVAAVRPWVTISQKSISPNFTSQGCLGKACTSSAQHVAETITFLPDLLSGNLESAASTLSWAGPETGRTTDLSTGHALDDLLTSEGRKLRPQVELSASIFQRVDSCGLDRSASGQNTAVVKHLDQAKRADSSTQGQCQFSEPMWVYVGL